MHRKPGWQGPGLKTWHVRKINGVPLYRSPKHWIYFKTTLSIPCLYFSCHSSSYSVSIPMKVRMIVTFPRSPFFAYLLQTPDNSNVFWFPYKVWVVGIDCILFTKSTNQSSWTDSGQTKLSASMAFLLLRRRHLSHETSQWRDRSMGKRLYLPTLPFESPYENISVNNNIVNLEQFNATVLIYCINITFGLPLG